MKILVVSEVRNDKIKSGTFEALGKANEFQNSVVESVLIGKNVQPLAGELAIYGAKKVYIVEDDRFGTYSAQSYATQITNVAKQSEPDLILASATVFGKEIMPRVAVKLNTGLATDCIELTYENNEFVATRPVYAGKARIKVKFKSKPVIVTLRPKIFKPITPREQTFETVKVNPEIKDTDYRATVVKFSKSEGEFPELVEADIIVSGGRGLKAPENFKLIEDLARVLHAAVGASRAAVDAGWKPATFQVGQTGKVVSPQLYIACGISGAIQHLAGMSSSKIIVAINKDPNAPIFKVADFGVIGDVFQVVPLLTQELKKVKTE